MGRYTDPAIRSYAFTFDEVDGQSNHSGPESVSGSDTDRASAEVGRLYLRTPEHVPSIPSSFRPQCDDAAKSNNAWRNTKIRRHDVYTIIVKPSRQFENNKSALVSPQYLCFCAEFRQFLQRAWINTLLRSRLLTFSYTHADCMSVGVGSMFGAVCLFENALGKEASNKIMDLMQSHAEISQPSSAKTYDESICLECCVVWEWNVDFTERGYSATWGIWNVDMEAYDESIVDWAQNKRMRNDGHSQKSTEEMVRSYPQTWFITKDHVRRTNTRGKGCGRPRTLFLDWLLKTEEDNKIKMVSVKIETCHNGQNTTATYTSLRTSHMQVCNRHIRTRRGESRI